MCRTRSNSMFKLSFSVVVVVLISIVAFKTVAADGPGPTPAPLSFSRPYEQGIVMPELGATLAAENYNSLAVLFTQDWWNWKYSYHSSMTSQGTNSLQIWCDAKYKGRYGNTWHWVDNLWNSTWGTSLSVGGVADLTGEFVVWTHGTHLFDYGSNNWVWRSSDDNEATWL